MNYFYIILITVLSLLISKTYADDFIIRGGAGIDNQGIDGRTKLLGVRNETRIPLYGLVYANEIGGWTDKHPGHKSSLYSKIQLGVNPVGSSGIFAKAFFGPALITCPDSVLGSIPQFATDLSFGVQDRYNAVSIGYMHMSNAGIFSKVNKGRDYILIEVSFGL